LGREAAVLGWTAVDVFGLHPVVPDAHYDGDALGAASFTAGK
jgi:hypothetical protein